MSREPKRMEKNARGSSKIVIYISVAIIIAIVIISYIIIGNVIGAKKEQQEIAKQNQENSQVRENEEKIVSEVDNENSESVSTQIGKTVDESEKENTNTNVNTSTNTNKQNTSINNTNTSKENTTTNSNNTTTNANTAKEKVEESKEDKEIVFIMPVEGEIIKGYAKDNLVYSETLQEWIVHQAIDIKADSREVVKAAADGTVTAIKNDPRYGLTVIIEHDGGFKTVYSNLLTAEFVVEGEAVKQGQTIGTVGSSATFEIADDTHLHFEMLKDSVYVDPSIYIK